MKLLNQLFSPLSCVPLVFSLVLAFTSSAFGTNPAVAKTIKCKYKGKIVQRMGSIETEFEKTGIEAYSPAGVRLKYKVQIKRCEAYGAGPVQAENFKQICVAQGVTIPGYPCNVIQDVVVPTPPGGGSGSSCDGGEPNGVSESGNITSGCSLPNLSEP